jgi:tetratricopeptide (TPR) repeat protein
VEGQANDDSLDQGIEAARRGDDALALRYLQEAVEAEPENETAWLWLSAVVESDDDKRLCLENVLVLNRNSEPARRGLSRLAAAQDDEPQEQDQFIRRRVTPLTPAGAILYPERQERIWSWSEPEELQQSTVAGFSAESSYDDVWQGSSDLCAYCATEVAADDSRCHGCGRALSTSAFRYPKASSNLTIYWVLILGVAQIALALVLVNLLGGGSPASLAWQTVVLIGMVILAVGLVFCRFWSYLGSVVALLMTLAAMIIGWLLGPAVDDSIAQLTGREFFLVLAETPYALFAKPFSAFLRLLQYIAVPLALLFALFRVGPDFERVKERRVASLERGISDASRYYGAGADYAERGMWASAVLHYQRAAAIEPARPFYQRVLGEAYAQLGHYQRSLDVLESARQLTRDPEARAAIEQRIAEVEREAAVTRRADSAQ